MDWGAPQKQRPRRNLFYSGTDDRLVVGAAAVADVEHRSMERTAQLAALQAAAGQGLARMGTARGGRVVAAVHPADQHLDGADAADGGLTVAERGHGK